MKLFSASLAHETNGFSPIPTSRASFTNGLFYDPTAGDPSTDVATALELGLRRVARDRGHTVIDSLYAAATPSGPLPDDVYLSFRNRILEDLSAALPVDGVLLFLHGAQMSESIDDCEGDLLQEIRSICGPDPIIGVELDLHGNISPAMVRHADIMVMCLEYPHTDFGARACQVVELVEQAHRCERRPIMLHQSIPMMGIFHTTREPMSGLVAKAREYEGQNGILSVSIQHGFATADTPHTGAGVLIVAEPDAVDQASRAMQTLSEQFFESRDAIKAPALSVDEALDTAHTLEAPVIIADTSDNPGGGGAGDSTYFLERVLQRDDGRIALGAIWDPQAVSIATRAGVGAEVRMSVGGKTSPMSGKPIELDASVIAVEPSVFARAYGHRHDFGPHVALRCGSVFIVLCAVREQTHDPAIFFQLGVPLDTMQVVIVKSAQHFVAEFLSVSDRILYASPPGTVTTDYSIWPYQALRRPIWPLDEPPFERDGVLWPG